LKETVYVGMARGTSLGKNRTKARNEMGGGGGGETKKKRPTAPSRDETGKSASRHGSSAKKGGAAGKSVIERVQNRPEATVGGEKS